MTDGPKRDAYERLELAIQDVMSAEGWNTGTSVTTTWVVLAHQAGFDNEGGHTSQYPIIYRGGNESDHTALGLFRVADLIVSGSGRWAREE